MLDDTNPDLHSILYLWGESITGRQCSISVEKNFATETAGVHRFTYILTQKMATILKPSLVVFGQVLNILSILSMHGIFHLHRCSYIYYVCLRFFCV